MCIDLYLLNCVDLPTAQKTKNSHGINLDFYASKINSVSLQTRHQNKSWVGRTTYNSKQAQFLAQGCSNVGADISQKLMPACKPLGYIFVAAVFVKQDVGQTKFF